MNQNCEFTFFQNNFSKIYCVLGNCGHCANTGPEIGGAKFAVRQKKVRFFLYLYVHERPPKDHHPNLASIDFSTYSNDILKKSYFNTFLQVQLVSRYERIRIPLLSS